MVDDQSVDAAPGDRGVAQQVASSDGRDERRQFWRVLLVIAGLALVFRVTYVLTVARHDDPTRQYDAHYYLQVSKSIIDGDGFKAPYVDQPTAAQTPMTSLVIVPATAIFGLDGAYTEQRLTMALLGTAVVIAVGLVGREIAGRRAGYLAAVVAALYPNVWVSHGIVMADTLAHLSVALALLFVYRFLRDPRWANAAWLGLICGFGALSRAELILMIPFLAVPAALLARGPTLGVRVRLLVITMTVCVVTVSPWVVRNMVTFREPTFLSTGDGAILGSSCDETYYGDHMGLWSQECAVQFKQARDPSVASVRQREAAFKYIGNHLGRLPVVMAVRVLRIWDVYRPFQNARYAETEGRNIVVGWIGLVVHWLFIVLCFVGFFAMKRRGLTRWPLLMPIVFITMLASMTQGAIRYRAPAEVAVVLLGSFGLDAVWSWWRLRRSGGHPDGRALSEAVAT